MTNVLIQRDKPTVGFVSPPSWFDPSPDEFAALALRKVGVQQTILPLIDFEYSHLENLAATEPEMEMATRLLAAAGCTAISHTATPFSFAGITTEQGLRDRVKRFEDASGAAVVTPSVAIIDALHALGARRIAVATPYYDQVWQAAWAQILDDTEFDVLAMQSLDQQGLSEPITDIYSKGWSMNDQLILSCVENVYKAAPRADVVVMTGAGSRTVKLIARMEEICGVPVIASDTSTYWALSKRVGVQMEHRSLGTLTDA